MFKKNYNKIRGYRALALAIGEENVKLIIKDVREHYNLKNDDSLSILLEAECAKIAKVSNILINMITFNSNQSPKKSWNKSVYESIKEAAQWICECSNSIDLNEKNRIEEIIRSRIDDNLALYDFYKIDLLHKSLVQNVIPKRRAISNDDSPILSSVVGKELFIQQLEKVRLVYNNPFFPKLIFSSIICLHPFTDGNGRVARTIYAISSIQKKSWYPLNKKETDELTFNK